MFDPSFNNYLSLNWLFIFLLLIIILPGTFWLIQSRILFIFKLLLNK